jgi:leucyl aminopeptidase (aminopeptidase T)
MPASPAPLARAVLHRNLRVQRGESVIIETWPHCLPYARAFVDEARRLGAQPTVFYEDEEAWWNAAASNRVGPFARLSGAEKAAVSESDVYVYFWGPEDMPRALALPKTVAPRLVGFNDEWYAIAQKAGLRGCRMSVGLAGDSAASHFGLPGAYWRSRLLEAGSVDAAKMRGRGGRIARALEHGSELRIRHSNGTDLRLRLNGVRTRVDTGILDEAALNRPRGMLGNNPTGQVMAAIDASEGTGSFVSNRPVYSFTSYEKFAGQRWRFAEGRLTGRSMTVGGPQFEQAFGAAPKGRDRLGFVSLGLNPATRELAPCEDTEEGAVMVGVGNNGMADGKIRIPFAAMAILGGALVEVDGDPIARAGHVL